jgi:hypothetical protein
MDEHNYFQDSLLSRDTHVEAFERGSQYTVIVRRASPTYPYLWGSAGIKQNVSYATPLILHIHNEIKSAALTFGTETADGKQIVLGTLQPGETFSVTVDGIRGVFASTIAVESSVRCIIK